MSSITICWKEWIQPMYEVPPKEEWKMPLARMWHNERNTKSYTAQFTRSKKFNSFRRLQNRINLPRLISLYHPLSNEPNIFEIHLPPGRGHLLLWRPLHAHQIWRDQDSRHVCASQPAHPCGANGSNGGVKGCQSPREQIGVLLNGNLALLRRHRLVRWCSLLQFRVWHDSSLSLCFPHLCSPLCDCCSSFRGLVKGKTWPKTSKTIKGGSSASEHVVDKFGSSSSLALGALSPSESSHWQHIGGMSLHTNCSHLRCHLWWWEPNCSGDSLQEGLGRVNTSANVTFHHWWMVLWGARTGVCADGENNTHQVSFTFPGPSITKAGNWDWE